MIRSIENKFTEDILKEVIRLQTNNKPTSQNIDYNPKRGHSILEVEDIYDIPTHKILINYSTSDVSPGSVSYAKGKVRIFIFISSKDSEGDSYNASTSICETDKDYYNKLINYLEKVLDNNTSESDAVLKLLKSL